MGTKSPPTQKAKSGKGKEGATEEKQRPPRDAKNTRERGEGGDGEIKNKTIYVWAADTLEYAPTNPEEIVASWRGALRKEKKSISLEDMKVASYKRMRLDDGSIPRTFLGSEVHAHLVEGMETSEKREQIAKWTRLARQPVLTRKQAEIRYKILISGFYMGKNKRAGDERCCIKCLGSRAGMRLRGTAQAHIEDVRHAFHVCYKTLWARTLEWWEERTGQHVELNERTTLMGDRENRDASGEGTDFRVLEEPWAMLHAAVLQTMWEERSRSRSGVEARDVSVLWQLTKRRFARDAQDHIRHVMLQREYLDEDALNRIEHEGGRLSLRYLYEAWHESGVGTIRSGKVPFVLHVEAARKQQ